MAKPKRRFGTLEDYLISNQLSVDGQLDDGWGAPFPVKGRELEATVLFSDISRFSARSRDLTPTETLIFVNNYFAWITAEALRGGNAIIDKYIGDEMMLVFSKEFGSDDPFVEAVQTARWMGENDALDFCPHIGVASGRVIVGYVGTQARYDCSVFGAAVARAARCAAVKPATDGRPYSTSIVFPSNEWDDRTLGGIFPPIKEQLPDGASGDRDLTWRLLSPQSEDMKNIGKVEVRAIINSALRFPQMSAEDRAREGMRSLRNKGRF